MHGTSFLAVASALSILLIAASGRAMGPDPGEHTGAQVNPQTTKTDRPHIDRRREQTSGTRTESNRPTTSEARRRDY